MNAFAMFLAISVASFAEGLSLKASKDPEIDNEAFRKELEEAKLLKELEILVKSLDDDQLELLETIMKKDLDEASEFDMITAELKGMGMDENDIEDLKELSELMHEFLNQIPAIAKKLELTHEYDLLDNVQLYLLGLPNKLGPLGYIALHHVLEDDEDEEDDKIVDMIIEPVAVRTTTTTTTAPTEPPQTEAQTVRRKRSSPLEQVLRLRRHA